MRPIESNEETMYTLKPIVSLPLVLHHADCMYKMKNIHEVRGGDHTTTEIKIVADVKEQVIKFLKYPLPEYTALEARQEKILTQLAELRKQVSTLCNFLKRTNQVETTTECTKEISVPLNHVCHKEKVTTEMIINVNPKKPPYSILALQKLLDDTIIKVQSYVHSSIAEQPPNIYNCDTSPKDIPTRQYNVINITLIWKEVEDLEVILGLHYSVFSGEVNFLRYISRVIDKYNYANGNDAMYVDNIDAILDICYCIHYEKSTKKQLQLLQSISDKLKDNWFGKDNPNIADIATWSMIKQLSFKILPLNLKKWFEACEKVFK